EPVHGNLVGLDYRVLYCGTETDPPPPCDAVLTGGTPVTHECALPALPGWHAVACYPLLSGEGKQWGAGSVVRDVTERRWAEEKIREQATLLEKTTDAIVVEDLEDRILYWNRGAERLYGWAAEQAVGRTAGELCGTGLLEARAEARRAVLAKGEWYGEL